jgi:ubiquinone/menaquinone biosynthesis C-methylase UbiE
MGVASLATPVKFTSAMTPPSNSAAVAPAALAFDAIAPQFDERFGVWASVAAQRRAVRAALLREFPSGGKILELGGGTGEDATFLAAKGFQVLLTDPSPAMVSLARNKLATPELAPHCSSAEILAAEDMEEFAGRKLASGEPLFDGAFSNFAPLNCVADLNPVARGLARLLKPGAPAMIIVFGVFCPGEMVTELLRRRPRNAFRRFQRGQTAARLSGHDFHVVYHRRADLLRAFAPWFKLEKRLGIGVTLPPSAAEPWITRHQRLLAAMESIDRVASRPLACFGDHVLYQFRRTHVATPRFQP